MLIKLQDCGFKVTSVIAEPLRVLVQSWSDEEEEQKSINPNFETWKSSQILSEDDAKKVNECARQIEKTINAESSTMMAFILESRKYDVEKLLYNVESLMHDGTFSKLTELAKIDVASAGKALAFDMPTASAFHILRASEDALREFYEKRVKRNRIDEPRNWGSITQHLKKISKPLPKELMDQLDHVRENFRNRTQHPDRNYSMDEAEALFAHCTDLISRLQTYALEQKI